MENISKILQDNNIITIIIIVGIIIFSSISKKIFDKLSNLIEKKLEKIDELENRITIIETKLNMKEKNYGSKFT